MADYSQMKKMLLFPILPILLFPTVFICTFYPLSRIKFAHLFLSRRSFSDARKSPTGARKVPYTETAVVTNEYRRRKEKKKSEEERTAQWTFFWEIKVRRRARELAGEWLALKLKLQAKTRRDGLPGGGRSSIWLDVGRVI